VEVEADGNEEEKDKAQGSMIGPVESGEGEGEGEDEGEEAGEEAVVPMGENRGTSSIGQIGKGDVDEGCGRG
jgi:hypothetical protein